MLTKPPPLTWRNGGRRRTAARMLRAAVLLGLVCMLVPATGWAGGSQGTRLVYNVGGSDDVLGIAIKVISAPNVPCSGNASHGERTMILPPLTTGPAGAGKWSWQVAPGVRAGTWRIHVECSHPDLQQATITFRASATGGHRPSAALHVGAIHSGAVPGRASGGNGEGGGSLYPVGQCTWYVATRRPDLPYFPGKSGNALNWIASAEKHHIPVGDVPVPGAVAVFQPGQYGAGKYGHVAYVVSVDYAANRMTVAEYNLLHPHAKDEKPMPWAGVQFIYGGPAGIGLGPGSPGGPTGTATPPANLEVPAIVGKAEVGSEVSCVVGLWSGRPPIEYSYRWLRDGVPVSGAARSSYMIRESAGGYMLVCEVTAMDAGGNTSAASEPVEIVGPPVNVSPPTLSGTPAAEQTLTCLVGLWEGPGSPRYTYKWWRNGTLSPGAELSTYYVTKENAGDALYCEVKAKNAYGVGTAKSNTLVVPSG